MAKKKNKNTRPVKDKGIPFDELAFENPALAQAYITLVKELDLAQANAEERALQMRTTPQEVINLRPVEAVLNQHPQLVRYLQSVAQREEARNPDLAKQSPTGSFPQMASTSGWSWSANEAKNPPIGVSNAAMLRGLADSNEWASAAINLRCQQIGTSDIGVLPADETKPYDKKAQKDVQTLMDQPNEYGEDFFTLMRKTIQDILVLDRGIILKNMTVARKPMALYSEDGAAVQIYPAWNGDPKEPRYLYQSPYSSKKVPLRNDEVMMFQANPASYRYGLSPTMVLKNTINADIRATMMAMQVADQKPPPHMIQLPGASPKQLEDVRAYYQMKIMGNKEVFWMGGPNEAKVFPLVFSAKDNQFLEWQIYLARKICACYQVSPQQLGITMDINRANGEAQLEIYEDTGLIPLLLLIEEIWNRQLLIDFATRLPMNRFDLEKINLRILFPEVTEADRQLHVDRSLKVAQVGLAGMPSMTINQVLKMRGEEPVPGGNTFYIPSTFVPAWSYDGKAGEYTPLSDGGQIGAQDPEGGPTDNADTDTGEGKDEPPAGAGGADSGDSGNNAGSDAGASPSGDSTKSYQLRKAGKHWRPEYDRPSPKVTKSTRRIRPGTPAPAGLTTLQTQTSLEVDRVFNDAAARGEAALSKHK